VHQLSAGADVLLPEGSAATAVTTSIPTGTASMPTGTASMPTGTTTTKPTGTTRPTTSSTARPSGAAPSAVRPAPRDQEPPARRSRLRGLLSAAGPEALALAVAGSVFGYRVAAPSPWRDEGATMVIAARPFGEIVDLVSRLDLVHAAYYLLVHVLLLADRTATLADAVPAVRTLSVLAATATAVLLVRIGRRLGSVAVGLSAALALVAAPLASRYAQEARSYALVMLATTLATLLLLRATARPRSRLAWCLYAAALVLTTVLNVISLLVVLAHAVYVRVMVRRAVRQRWLLAVAGGLGAASPFVAATFLQRGQVDWLFAPRVDAVPGFYAAQYHGLAVLLGVAGTAVALVQLPGRFDLRRLDLRRYDLRRLDRHPSRPARVTARLGATNRGALVLGLAWAVLPVVTLWVVSQAEPLYTWRYLIFTLPGTALVVGSLATALRPIGIVVPLLVLGLSGLHVQGVYRDPHVGHAEDMAGVGEYVAAHARAGDAVLWVPGGPGHMRTLAELYPERYAGLIDVALESSGAATATITGVEKEPAQIAGALHGRKRVWLISGPSGLGQAGDAVDREKSQLLLDGYRIKKVDTVLRFQVALWERLAPGRTTHRPVDPRPAVILGENRAL
jgi:mannosyltransferase